MWTLRILASVASGVVLVGAAVLGARGIAGLHATATTAQLQLLDSGARELQRALDGHGAELPEIATTVAADPTLAIELKTAVAATTLLTAGRPVPAAVKARTDALLQKLDARLSDLRVREPSVDGVALLSETGAVLVTDSKRLKAGETPAALGPVLEGRTLRSTSLHEGQLYFFGGAPIRQKGKVVGAVVVEQKVASLIELPGLQAALISATDTVLGSLPAAATPKAAFALQGAGLLAPGQAPVGPLSSAPWFIETRTLGLVGRAAPLTLAPELRVVVSADLAPPARELGAAQWRLVLLALLAWLAHVLAILAPALKELLTRDRRVVPVSAAQAPPPVLPSAPSVDDVIAAQAVLQRGDDDSDTTEIEFEGIIDAGGVAIGVADTHPPEVAAHDEPLTPAVTPFAEDEATPGEAAAADDDEAAPDEGAAASEAAPGATSEDLEESPGTRVDANAAVAEALALADDLPPRLPADEEPAPRLPTEAPGVGSLPTLVGPAPGSADATAVATSASEATQVLPKANPEDATYRRIYDEFVATRTSCGEPGELPFEKFKTRLIESRAQVMARHSCRDVEFTVYVKNGRAALKAMPAR